MANEFTEPNIEAGKRVSINNPRSVPIKVVVRIGGGGVEFGLTPGQFFTIVGNGSRIGVEFRDIDGSELEHPGPIGPDVVPGQPNRH